MKVFIRFSSLCLASVAALNLHAADRLVSDAEQALDKAIVLYHSLSVGGGYTHHYSADQTRMGDNRLMMSRTSNDAYADNDETALIGAVYLRAYMVTGKESYRQLAQEVASTLEKAQNPLGGWERKFYLDGRAPGRYCDLWYPPTRDALLFLMSLDGKEPSETIKRGLAFLMKSQFANGAWPPYYPVEARYPDGLAAPYFFNDGTTTESLNVAIEAYKKYKDPDLLETAKKAGAFIRLSQLPPPQSGWAQQYNQHLQPAWYRHFEPASVCSRATLGCMESLVKLFLVTGIASYLDPIPDALRWLRESVLPNERWARFYEIGTNKPLYYDYGRKRVSSIQELSPERQIGYEYEIDLDLDAFEAAYEEMLEMGREAYLEKREIKDPKGLEGAVRRIIQTQESDGGWITVDNGKYLPVGKQWVEWNGERKNEEILASAVFRDNALTLCDFIEASRR